jgi:hypothetical protein
MRRLPFVFAGAIALMLAFAARSAAPLTSPVPYICPSATAAKPMSAAGATWPNCAGAIYQAPTSAAAVIDIGNAWALYTSAVPTSQVWSCPKGAYLSPAFSACTTTATGSASAAAWTAFSALPAITPPTPPATYSVALKWTAPTLDTSKAAIVPPLSFNIYEGLAGITPAKVLAGLTAATSTVTGVPAGNSCFTVTAVTAQGESAPSNQACLTEPGATKFPPAAPAALSAAAP